MSVKDVIKKSVLESGAFGRYDIPAVFAALIAALLLGILSFWSIRSSMRELFISGLLR